MNILSLCIPWAHKPFLLLYKWNGRYTISEFNSHKCLQQYVRRQDAHIFSEVYRFYREKNVYIPYTTIFGKVFPIYTLQQVCNNYSELSNEIKREFPIYAFLQPVTVS